MRTVRRLFLSQPSPRNFITLVVCVSMLAAIACNTPGLNSSPEQSPAGSGGEPTGEQDAETVFVPPRRPTIDVSNLPPTPPQIVARRPFAGEELPPNGAVTLYFDQPMDQDSVIQSLEFTQQGTPVDFETEWVDDATLMVRAVEGQLQRSSEYSLVVGMGARSRSGIEVEEATTLPLLTLGFLEVGEFSPTGGATGTDTPITLLFNRPVVALGEERGLPLSISPAVQGQGEWLNTSIYQFTPAQPLEGGQTYTVTLEPGIVAEDGAELRQPVTWEFTTLPPDVLTISPEPESLDVPLDGEIVVEFNQPMDQLSVQNSFAVTTIDGANVPGNFNWDEDDRTVTFVPSAGFAYDGFYLVEITSEALGAGGTPLSREVSWQFSSVATPAVAFSEPFNGQTDWDVFRGVRINFTAPMDEDTIDSSLIVSEPELPDPDAVFYNRFDSSLTIGSYLEPSTTYTITLLPGAADPNGTTIDQAYTFSFTTAPLQPEVILNTQGIYGLYDGSRETELFVLHRNVDSINFTLSQIDLSTFVTLAESFEFEQVSQLGLNENQILRSWNVETENELNESFFLNVPLAEEGGILPDGIYLLVIDSPEVIGAPIWHFVIVTNSNLTYKETFDEAFVWLTDLQSGEPIPNAQVAFYDSTFNQIGTGTTGPDGILEAPIAGGENLFERSYAVVDSGGLFTIAQSNWGEGFQPFDFAVNAAFFREPFEAYMYTDRPIYRPGDDVFFKGILREPGEDQSLYRLPQATNVDYRVYNNQGEIIIEDVVAINEYGTFNGVIPLVEDAGIGGYNIEVTIGDRFANQFFSVAEYRPPDFFLELEPESSDVLAGEDIEITVNAEFFFGGGVSEAPLTYTVLSDAYFFDRYEGPGFYSFTDFDVDEPFDGQGIIPGFGRVIEEGEGTTDEDGQFTITIPADISENATSRIFTVDVGVEDIGGQVTFERIEVIVHKSQYYVGVQPDNYVGQAESEQAMNLLVVDWQGEPVGGVDIDVEFLERVWNSVREESPTGQQTFTYSVEETQIGDVQQVRSADDGTAQVTVTPPSGGNYKVLATVTDPDGNEARGSTILWVSSSTFVPWRIENNKQVELVLDRDEYVPGDTAEILIASPFAGGDVSALITIERNGVLSYEILDITSNSLVYELPITGSYAPNIYVSVLLLRAADADNPVPDFRVGLAQLNVTPVEQTLNISLTPSEDQVGPGDTVSYTVETTDFNGNPVDAEVSLALVDLAVLELANPNSRPIVEYFYGSSPLQVRTAVPMSILVDQLNQELFDRGKGGGGGGGGGFFDIREEFEDTAFWTATLRTGDDGVEVVEIALPDNLTTWRMDARGVTLDTLVGQAEVDIVTSRPLLIRPMTPRFFVAGDEATLSAIVNNNTDEDIEADVTMRASGLRIIGAQTETISIPAGDRVQVDWPVIVNDDAEFANLLFGVESESYQDAAKPPLGQRDNDQRIPIYRYTVPERITTAGQLDQEETRIEGVVLPPTYDVDNAEVEVLINTSLAASTLDGLNWLEQYPFLHTELVVSRLLANAVTARTVDQFAIDDAELAQNLDRNVDAGIQSLYARQSIDGGWGWRGTTQSDLLTTAYAVQGLLAAQKSGYTLDQNVLDSAYNYLRTELEAVSNIDLPEVRSQQAYVLYVLARAGQADAGRVSNLYESREGLPPYATALLAQAIWYSNPSDPRLADLEADLLGSVLISGTGAHWENNIDELGNWSTDTRTTAIVLDTFALIWPENDLMPNIVRWLMAARLADHWPTTQETAWSIIGLTDFMEATGELDANYNWSFDFNGEPFAEGTASQANLTEQQSVLVPFDNIVGDGVNRMAFERSAGGGALYYSANLSTYLPADRVQAQGSGIIVSRQYFNENGTRVTEGVVGDIISVLISVTAPNDLNFVVVEDYYPAGAEAVNPNLLNESILLESPTVQVVNDFDDFGEPIYSYGYGSGRFTAELRDERAVLLSEYLPAGSYQYSYQIRLGTVGRFNVIPTNAFELYFPDVFGRGEGTEFTILPQ